MPRLIGAGAAAQPVVQRGDARVEAPEIMMLGQRGRCAEDHASSHRALVDMVRLRRSFTCAGASSRARYSRGFRGLP